MNDLKAQETQAEGGQFSINEFGQVIARMAAPAGQRGSIQVIGVTAGVVYTHPSIITFNGGALNPTETPDEGMPWPGPRCGISYTFSAPGAVHHPSRAQDEIWVKIGGTDLQLSAVARVAPYPPTRGRLLDFLQALRRLLPPGGRFRVNEHGRAFTSDDFRFIGVVPVPHWFAPLTDRA